MASILSTTKTASILDTTFNEVEACFTHLKKIISTDFDDAIELLIHCKGKIIFCGLGKTGHIANYAASLFSSLGIKCQFLHANEALHGDMGMIDREKDVFVFISFSGNGDEHLFLINQINLPAILISSNKHSAVGEKADVNIDIEMNKSQESYPLHCLPTHSNVLFMFVINTLAMSYCELKGINKNHFSANHPGGQIGRDMFMTVGTIMRPKEKLPCTTLDTSLIEALPMITSGHCGSIMLLDEQQNLYGIFTDGDLRRALDDPDNLYKPLKHFANKKYHTCQKNELAKDALTKMRNHEITALIVLDDKQTWVGLVHIHDILRLTKCSESS